jgi:hypothetical protein
LVHAVLQKWKEHDMLFVLNVNEMDTDVSVGRRTVRMKTVEYKKEIPEGLVLGRNKVIENGKTVRIRVDAFQYGRQNLEDAKKASMGIFTELKKMFGDNALEDGFNGFKITRIIRS